MRVSNSDNRVMSEINVTPLVDVMLVLLIVFIITAPVMHQAFKLDLPKESAQKLDPQDKFITIEISSTGEFSLDGVILEESSLLEELRQKKDSRIHLKADQSTQYANVAKILGLAHQAGLDKISFLTTPIKDTGN